MPRLLIFVVFWLKGASHAATCSGRYATRTSAFIRITSRENLSRLNIGSCLDHSYTHHKALNMTSAVPLSSTDKMPTSFSNEQPCPSLHFDNVSFTSSPKQQVDYDVQPLTCEDLTETLSNYSPVAESASNIKPEDVTSCTCVEDSEQLLSLISNSNFLPDEQPSRDTDRVSDTPIETGRAPKLSAGKERVIHICDHCGKSFVRGKDYAEHRRTHTGERPFHCDICGRGFSRFRSVAEHRRQHTGNRPFVCDICAKQFFTSGELLKHRRYHSGEKRYSCSICGKQFLRCGDYTDHRRVHTGENICLICGKTFTRQHNMKEHMNSAHAGAKRFNCSTCGKQFAYSSGLRYHRRLHEADRPFKCQECGRCFARMGELNRHRRSTHKIVNLPTTLLQK